MKTAIAWTGGKDSALALDEVRRKGRSVDLLVSFAPGNANFLAHPLAVQKMQAESLGLPHRVVTIHEPYEESYRAAIKALGEDGFGSIVTGDIDLVGGQPNWMRKCAAGSGVEIQTLLWMENRLELLDRMIGRGFKIIITATAHPMLGEKWVGRILDTAVRDELEALEAWQNIDPCGENGEFHTMVIDGPGFKKPIDLGPWECASKEHFYYMKTKSHA